jgi:hypothetical protein
MLSNIAFKLAVGNAMPRVSYFTYMVNIFLEQFIQQNTIKLRKISEWHFLQDFYILLSLVQMGLVLGWHAVVHQICKDDDANWTALLADRVAMIVLGCFYLVFNTLYLCVNLCRVYRLTHASPVMLLH